MYCHQCSGQNPDSANFCRVCGASMKQIQQPTTNSSPAPHMGEPQQLYPPGQRLLRPLGTVFLSLGAAIFALFIIFVLLAGSIGLLELLIVLIISSIPISLGLLLRHLSRVRGEQNWTSTSGGDTTELTGRRGSKSLSPGASVATPVSYQVSPKPQRNC
jgi:hypothetical protein